MNIGIHNFIDVPVSHALSSDVFVAYPTLCNSFSSFRYRVKGLASSKSPKSNDL